MSRFVEPIKGVKHLRVNATLHGRSVHRKRDVPGHNVFKGYNTPGVGDAIDWFDKTNVPVYAIADCVQTAHRNDANRLEVITLEGEGWLAIYAHIDAVHNGAGKRFRQNDVVGRLRGDLKDPHLHFELWIKGRAIHAPTPGQLRVRLIQALGLDSIPVAAEEGGPRLIVAKPALEVASLDGLLYNELPSRWNKQENIIEVDTDSLKGWLGKTNRGLVGFVPIREALQQLNVEATYDLKHLHSVDPRIYVFTR